MVKKSCKSFWSLRGLCVKFFISFSRPALYCSLQVLLKKDGNQNEQQNPKCQQFLLFATGQAPENHGCTLRCVRPPPNPLVVFPLGQQSAPPYLGSPDLAPIFGLESVVHGGPLQHVFSRVLAVRVEAERYSGAGRVPNHEPSNGFGRGVFRKKRMHEGESSQN